MGTLPEFVKWMTSYQPETLFNADGSLKEELRDFAPKGEMRMASNPVTNGELILLIWFYQIGKNLQIQFLKIIEGNYSLIQMTIWI